MFVGYGQLAKAMIEILPNDQIIQVFSRSKEAILQSKRENIKWIGRENFYEEKEVWLFLPEKAIPRFLQEHVEDLHPHAKIYYCATKGKAKDVQSLIKRTQSIIPVKFITQATQLMKDRKGLAGIPRANVGEMESIRTFFKGAIDIVRAEEEEVYFVNKIATKIAIEAICEFEEELNNRDISQEIIEHAGKQMIPGVIHAYLHNKLGGFGQQVLKERKSDQ
ncbi:hypothetical protein [Evansella cellulosilytica]|uniref:Pyrroline-5-carboxylate reductase catalytic N-terminal domain-containing protein n=1 Tax=Evansella cellulosilytica (strain ATCC 21833 / DSM 2522 / FERM P-1141 / JCM 9156 / N-4) TaxID=649639 RepID=E6U1A0_EVAC2|nr:hypothetical protein [Evansella cellulosilytica]ADU31546.1 hypothetical protein Bcell_3304 [Evansella cellulosilytica DSM 2522]